MKSFLLLFTAFIVSSTYASSATYVALIGKYGETEICHRFKGVIVAKVSEKGLYAHLCQVGLKDANDTRTYIPILQLTKKRFFENGGDYYQNENKRRNDISLKCNALGGTVIDLDSKYYPDHFYRYSDNRHKEKSYYAEAAVCAIE